MTYNEIRKTFVSFFEAHQHRHVESSSLIPHQDPSLMFTNAGMNQFKDVFLGHEQAESPRAVSVQKCLRAGGKHNDLENVGFTARHHTFFEMLGNFSFGDYFKKEAIAMAWEFLTKTLAIPEERLYVTVFTTDDEAADIWEQEIGVPRERISRFGEKDNFWRMGQTGPCGPCSEIFYDHRPDQAPVPIDQDEDRFVEIWNLVFMQFFEDESGRQSPLPKPSVDTGAGIERLAAVLQGVEDNYQTDIFTPLIQKACRLSNHSDQWDELKKTPQTLGALKVVADHARATSFLIAEGVLPSNEGRGYVLRRIMRRAIRYARQLTTESSLFPQVCAEVIHLMGEAHPLLEEKKSFIIKSVHQEESRFLQTLDRGNEILLTEIAKARENGLKELSGQTAFTLYDTYGFPLDLTEVVAREQGFSVNTRDFQAKLEQAKVKARNAQKSHSITGSEQHLAQWTESIHNQHGTTEFLGYDKLQSQATLLALSDGQEECEQIHEKGFVVFQHTPFYPEGGGQVADQGDLYLNDQVVARVVQCQKINDVIVHEVQVHEGRVLQRKQQYLLHVESQERRSTAANHSATHLLHATLKKVLGDHVNQAGSLVNSEKLRFDFSHNQALNAKDLEDIENQVNEAISAALPVTAKVLPHGEALAQGAVAMFGEKYGDQVRVITMGDSPDSFTSKELCGGTHVDNTSEIRLFKVVSQGGVAAGVRRIEAVTGHRAFLYTKNLAQSALKASHQLNISLPEPAGDMNTLTKKFLQHQQEIEKKIEGLFKENKKLQQQLQKAKAQSISLDELLTETETLKGSPYPVLFTRLPIDDRKALKDISDKLRAKEKKLVLGIVGDSQDGEAMPMIIALGSEVKGLHAGKMLKSLSELLGGKGGGRPDFAQGSVTNLDPWNQAKKHFYEFLQKDH